MFKDILHISEEECCVWVCHDIGSCGDISKKRNVAGADEEAEPDECSEENCKKELLFASEVTEQLRLA